MVRTIITPQNNTLSSTIPDSLVGRKLEVIAFALEDELVNEPVAENKEKPSQMRGFFKCCYCGSHAAACGTKP